MVRNRDGITGGKKPSLQDEEEHLSSQGGPELDVEVHQEAAESETLEGAVVLTNRVRFNINTRKARIDPGKKRVAFVRQLEQVMSLCDRIIANPEGVDEIQFKAMNMLIKSIQVCYGMVVDVEVEELEREIRSLEEKEERLISEEKNRGYRIQEDPTE